MVNNIVYFPALYAGYLFYETLTRDIRDDSDIKNTLSFQSLKSLWTLETLETFSFREDC